MRHFLVLFLLVASPPALALKEYYSISRSVRSLGMGGAFYGLSNDEYALFYNPAGLSLYPQGSQGMLNFQAQIAPNVSDGVKIITDSDGKNIDQIVLDLQQFQGKPLYGGATFFPYYLRKHFAVGLLAPDVKVDVAVLGRDFDTIVDITGIGDAGLFIGYANSFFDKDLHIGINLKGIYRVGGSKIFTPQDIVEQKTADLKLKDLGGGGAGFDFDLGAIYELPFKPFNSTIRTSLTLNNLLATQFTMARIEDGGAPPGLVRMLSLGGHWRLPGWQVFDHFDVVLDLAEFGLGGEDDSNRGGRGGGFFKHLNWGVEAPFLNEYFALRLGFRQGYLTAGFGILTRFFKLDLATYQEELFSNPGQLGSRRFAARVAFGFGAAPPAVEPQTEAAPADGQPVEETPAAEPRTEEPPPADETPQAPPSSRLQPEGAKGKKPQNRQPSSTESRRVVKGNADDRFNVDSLVEEYPESYKYPDSNPMR